MPPISSHFSCFVLLKSTLLLSQPTLRALSNAFARWPCRIRLRYAPSRPLPGPIDRPTIPFQQLNAYRDYMNGVAGPASMVLWHDEHIVPGPDEEDGTGPVIYQAVRAFIAPLALRAAYQHMRPLIAIDACFSKTPHWYKVCIAAGYDAANQLVPIAWGFISLESNDGWEWWCRRLLEAYPAMNKEGTAIMTDRGDVSTHIDRADHAGTLTRNPPGLPTCYAWILLKHIRRNARKHLGIEGPVLFNKLLYAKDEAVCSRHRSSGWLQTTGKRMRTLNPSIAIAMRATAFKHLDTA